MSNVNEAMVDAACKAYDAKVDELGDSAMEHYCNDVPMWEALRAALDTPKQPSNKSPFMELVAAANRAIRLEVEQEKKQPTGIVDVKNMYNYTSCEQPSVDTIIAIIERRIRECRKEQPFGISFYQIAELQDLLTEIKALKEDK